MRRRMQKMRAGISVHAVIDGGICRSYFKLSLRLSLHGESRFLIKSKRLDRLISERRLNWWKKNRLCLIQTRFLPHIFQRFRLRCQYECRPPERIRKLRNLLKTEVRKTATQPCDSLAVRSGRHFCTQKTALRMNGFPDIKKPGIQHSYGFPGFYWSNNAKKLRKEMHNTSFRNSVWNDIRELHFLHITYYFNPQSTELNRHTNISINHSKNLSNPSPQ